MSIPQKGEHCIGNDPTHHKSPRATYSSTSLSKRNNISTTPMSEVSQAYSDLRSIQASLLQAITARVLDRATDREPKLKAECEGSEEVRREVLSVLQSDPTLGKGLEALVQTKVADGYSQLTKDTRWPDRRVSWSINVTDALEKRQQDWMSVKVLLTCVGKGIGTDAATITSQETIGGMIQSEDPHFTWEKYRKVKDCSSSSEPVLFNSLRRFTSTIWIEHNKELARAMEYFSAVGILHSHGPEFESYIQRVEGEIRRQILESLGRDEANGSMNTWIRNYSKKVVRAAWDYPKYKKNGYYKLDSLLGHLGDSNHIKLTRMRDPSREDGRMGTKVETYYGDVDCWNLRSSGKGEHVYSEWLDDWEVIGRVSV